MCAKKNRLPTMGLIFNLSRISISILDRILFRHHVTTSPEPDIFFKNFFIIIVFFTVTTYSIFLFYLTFYYKTRCIMLKYKDKCRSKGRRL